MLQTVTDPDGNPFSIVRKVDLSRDGIRQAIRDDFSGADDDDISLFFIATHGRNSASIDPEQAGSLTACNPETGMDEYITDDDLAKWLAAIPGKKIILLAWLRDYRDPYLPGNRQHAQMYPARSNDPLFRRLGAAPTPAPFPAPTPKPLPKTGDEAPLALWMLFILAGVCGLA